jgi:hypothetical protein
MNERKSALERLFEDSQYPEPTVIIVDDDTDFSRMHEKVIVGQPKRSLIGLRTFACEEDFIKWQKEAPREIFEITPKALAIGERISTRIFVTYNAGVTDGT